MPEGPAAEVQGHPIRIRQEGLLEDNTFFDSYNQFRFNDLRTIVAEEEAEQLNRCLCPTKLRMTANNATSVILADTDVIRTEGEHVRTVAHGHRRRLGPRPIFTRPDKPELADTLNTTGGSDSSVGRLEPSRLCSLLPMESSSHRRIDFPTRAF